MSESLVGTILDSRYRILKRLGAGGMGDVYLAEHLQLDRREAIKVLKSQFSRDPGHLARFRREARATNRVQHRNIVGFYDFGKLPNGAMYLSMELADGPDLRKCLQQEGRFEVWRAIAIIRQLATAIGYAHSKGVIHRDLKPQNMILVQEPGFPDTLKVLDFGVAKITAAGYTESSAITMQGQLFGTPAYIAPEQIRGVRDDPRSDIYALGCIAYELVTGETPFTGRAIDIIDAQMSDFPFLPSHACVEANIPPDLDQLILDCLAKSPNDRPQTGEVVAERLSRMRHGSGAVLIKHATTGDDEEDEDGLFGQEPTLRGVPAFTQHDDDDTGAMDTAVNALALRRITRTLGETMCDLGCFDPELLVLLAELNQVKQEINLITTELKELGRSDQLVTQNHREGEASLRFALGELRFGQSSGQEQTALDEAIRALSERLADFEEQIRIQHGTITERQITKTAQRAHKQEQLLELDRKLSLLVDKHAETLASNTRVMSLRAKRDLIVNRIQAEVAP